jgi:CheY-like chemotaxis protein
MTGMVMPGGMSGADFTERVRQDHPTIKPILTSGYALEQMTRIASISWLRKPYTLVEFSRTLRNVLDEA